MGHLRFRQIWYFKRGVRFWAVSQINGFEGIEDYQSICIAFKKHIFEVLRASTRDKKHDMSLLATSSTGSLRYSFARCLHLRVGCDNVWPSCQSLNHMRHLVACFLVGNKPHFAPSLFQTSLGQPVHEKAEDLTIPEAILAVTSRNIFTSNRKRPAETLSWPPSKLEQKCDNYPFLAGSCHMLAASVSRVCFH